MMLVFKLTTFVGLLFSQLFTDVMAVAGKTNTDFIPCSDPCNGGDVNYHLTTSIRTMKLLNYTYRGRTYSRDGDDTFMGPTMHVKPGQSLWIKLTNNMTDDEENFGPKPPTAVEYWNMLQKPGERIKYQYYKKGVDRPSKMKVDAPNMPHDFSVTNLHLHGLDVEVHMFDPVGTHAPKAPHIAIKPGQCYCYQFNIPAHHPGGMYWYHPHLHGSTAIQIWSGMLGLVYVDGPLLEELRAFNVHNTQEFVIWDPAFRQVSGNDKEHNLEVDEFLMGQTTLSKIHPFLVNGQTNPTFQVKKYEVLHLRVLCGTIENENTFIVYPEGREEDPWDQSSLPFYVIAADGVTYPNAVGKNILVMSGGQRYEILLQFDEAGRYVISQQGIQGMQFFDMWGHPHDQILATIEVLPEDGESPTIPVAEMTFSPGYSPEESIQAHDIVETETIVFSMGANRDQAPFPQYYINGKAFDPDRLDFHAHPGEAREYLLVNANHNVHPFHIHVNRFQIKEMGSELSVKKYPALAAVMDFDPKAWRDTVVVPPNGRARIWVQYKNYSGKTLFHCHFLAHEDTGMMSTLFIGPPDFVFEWRDHIPLLLGLVIGALFGAAILYFVPGRRGGSDVTYSAVEMNQVKSKVMD